MQEGLEKLEIYQLGHQGALLIHRMSLGLPTLERFEEAPQIRRSSKRVSASIVEGYAQQRYKGVYLSYLYRALGSADETQEHLRLLKGTGSLKEADALLRHYETLSGKIFSYIEVIEQRYELPHYLQKGPDDSAPPEEEVPFA